MSTNVHLPEDDRPEPGAQSLMLWLGVAMLAVTVVIVLAITQLSLTGGVVTAFVVLLAAVAAVVVYILRFIGPEDPDH